MMNPLFARAQRERYEQEKKRLCAREDYTDWSSKGIYCAACGGSVFWEDPWYNAGHGVKLTCRHCFATQNILWP